MKNFNSRGFSVHSTKVDGHSPGLSNGRITGRGVSVGMIKPLLPPIGLVKSKIVYASCSSNYWSSTEYNNNNAWNVNFSSGQLNNNNKNNDFWVRPCVALGNHNEIKEWLEAYEDCCRSKKSSDECSEFRANYESDLLKLIREVNNRTYRPGPSVSFVVERPKFREIFAAGFRDRIVQHWLILRINPLFEERFESMGNVSFNCRKGYGTLAAVRRLKENMEKVSNNYTSEAYIGKFDIKSFFYNIDTDLLLELLIPFLKENYKGDDLDKLLWLLEITVRNHPSKNAFKRGNLKFWGNLASEKSLYNNPTNKGMPIGNITSQLFANFYLSFFDYYMIKRCKESGSEYVRFVDDFVVVCKTKDEVKNLRWLAEQYLKITLRLTLHPDKVYIQEVKKGVKFVGSVIKPGRIYLANRTVGGFYDSLVVLNDLCEKIHKREERGANLKSLLKKLNHCVSSVNSYLGFLVQTCSYHIRYSCFDKLTWFWSICDVAKKSRVVKIRKPYKLKNYYRNEEDR